MDIGLEKILSDKKLIPGGKKTFPQHYEQTYFTNVSYIRQVFTAQGSGPDLVDNVLSRGFTKMCCSTWDWMYGPPWLILVNNLDD